MGHKHQRTEYHLPDSSKGIDEEAKRFVQSERASFVKLLRELDPYLTILKQMPLDSDEWKLLGKHTQTF